jgi:hypothetical protein
MLAMAGMYALIALKSITADGLWPLALPVL